MTLADRWRATLDGPRATRAVALGAALVALAAPLEVMYHFVDVVGLPVAFLAVVAASGVLAAATARLLRPASAVAVGAVLLAGGLWWYLGQLSGDPAVVQLLSDTLGLVGGRSMLSISNLRAWVLGVAPAPVFLATYFAVRRRYTWAVVAAGAALGFFVLTGDADVVETLTGVVAGAVAIGLGDLDRRGESLVAGETVLVVAAVMIVVPFVVSVLPPAAAATGLVPDPGGAGTVETSLLGSDETLRVQGSIELSPTVRYTVESDEARRWRVAGYDRYTGEGWVRTGEASAYGGGDLTGPPGPTRPLTQRFRAESPVDVTPAAWRPVRAGGDPAFRVESEGSFAPTESLSAGQTYEVESRLPAASPDALQSAGTDYPDAVEGQYTGLPDSTPDRVAETTATITANAETPYETALVVERWLENNKEYSLDVRRPRGSVADSFLHEMDAGYCTYYATTMAAMLRSQDVPARFVTGYTSGERVAEDRWVVRGLNSHAWVEVYFPEYGWVAFDPTPAGPRDAARTDRVESARAENRTDVDTNETGGTEEWTPTPGPTPPPLTPTTTEDGSSGNGSEGTPPGSQGTRPRNIITDDALANGTGGDTPTPTGPAGLGPRLPTRQQLGLALVALVGTAVGVRRSGVGHRLYRAAWLRYQPRREPAADVERAFQRLLYHLQQGTYRTRRDGETVREYFDAVHADERAREVAAIRERARYAGDVSRAEADEAIRIVNDLVREW